MSCCDVTKPEPEPEQNTRTLVRQSKFQGFQVWKRHKVWCFLRYARDTHRLLDASWPPPCLFSALQTFRVLSLVLAPVTKTVFTALNVYSRLWATPPQLPPVPQYPAVPGTVPTAVRAGVPAAVPAARGVCAVRAAAAAAARAMGLRAGGVGLPPEDGGGFRAVVCELRMGPGPHTTSASTAATPTPPRCSHTTRNPPPPGGSRCNDQRGGARRRRGRTEER